MIIRAGVVIAFKGKYGKNPKLFKGLVELWCSETNTFHHPYGEVGISLWDIKELGCLSVIGEMYDEFVPNNSELTNYPCNLRQLLSVYKWLVNRKPGKAVYYNHWVDFWYRGPRKFTSQSREDSISEEERKKAPTYSEDGYLATFLALWLGKFVMPTGKRMSFD
uniref:Aminotransferase-like plant mobile domain-containing protein n=1 Tax=Ananas comosus var. bracteatus TaxID=296719 RepID=A0A6V7P9N7_ANACO|nr:unnamed protein product [Ananas comosus var. bracteatus]